MTLWVAFLRGINLGKRQLRSAELKAAYEAMGFANVRTLLASGNVLFETGTATDRRAIESAFAERFGFESGTVLRRQQELKQLVATDPFGGRAENETQKLYVTLLADSADKPLPMPFGVKDDYEVVTQTEREVFIVAYRKPDGRFSSGMEAVWKHLGKRVLWTSRNWNTVVKAAEK